MSGDGDTRQVISSTTMDGSVSYLRFRTQGPPMTWPIFAPHAAAIDEIPMRDTRTIQAYLGHKLIPAYGALHRAGANSVQKLISGLTAPAASFEATSAAPAARGSSNFSRKSR